MKSGLHRGEPGRSIQALATQKIAAMGIADGQRRAFVAVPGAKPPLKSRTILRWPPGRRRRVACSAPPDVLRRAMRLQPVPAQDLAHRALGRTMVCPESQFQFASQLWCSHKGRCALSCKSASSTSLATALG